MILRRYPFVATLIILIILLGFVIYILGLNLWRRSESLRTEEGLRIQLEEELDGVKKQNAQLQQELSSLREVNQNLKSQLSQTQSELKELRRQMERLEVLKKKMEEDLKDLLLENKRLKGLVPQDTN